MVEANIEVSAGDRLTRLTEYLTTDPQNLTLLLETAAAALGAGEAETARDLLERYAQIAPLTPLAMNLSGLAAMRLNEVSAAAEIFAGLLQSNPNDPSLRFNLAWAKAMQRKFDEAVELLDESTIQALPQAAMLHVQILHDRGKMDDATIEAKRLLDHHSDHSGLLAAASVLAIDIEDVAMARDCALRAGPHPDALTTLGLLALGEDDHAEAGRFFESALRSHPHAPRAWVGRGLVELAGGAHSDAARHIRHGAELFGGHVGSWIAAGWAYIVSSDLTAARQCFEIALSLDRNFGESHGSLAVVDMLEGRTEAARRSAQIALRLDARSFSAILAQSMLLAGEGRRDQAQAIIDRALHTPIDSSGRTLSMALAKHALQTG